MKLGDLHPQARSRKKAKRVGRGTGSGLGKTSGRGTKGQKSRKGRKPRLGFEGGQMPLQRRLPKRGFTSPSKTRFTPVNIGKLNQFEPNTEVTRELLYKSGLIKKNELPKLLAKGNLSIPLSIAIQQMSQAAREKILTSGGRILL